MKQENIREKLKFLRMFHRYTQFDVTKGTNIQQSILTALENGKRTISLKYLERFANFYNVDVSYFIDDNIDKEDFKYKTTNTIHVIGRNGDKEDIKLTDEEYKKEFGDKPKLTDEEITFLKKFIKNMKNS